MNGTSGQLSKVTVPNTLVLGPKKSIQFLSEPYRECGVQYLAGKENASPLVTVAPKRRPTPVGATLTPRQKQTQQLAPDGFWWMRT